MKPRSQPIRRTPLARGTKPIARSGKPNPVNRKRKAKNHERAYGEKRDWVVTLPCLICGYSPCDPAHVGTLGGGMKAGSERLVPLCGVRAVPPRAFDVSPTFTEGHHRESHRGIKTFQRKYGIDLKVEAARIEREWQSYSGGDDGE